MQLLKSYNKTIKKVLKKCAAYWKNIYLCIGLRNQMIVLQI